MTGLLHRLASEPQGSFLLFFPRRARAGRDPVDFELLSLFAREHRLSLVVCSANASLRARAAEVGLAVMDRLPEEPAAEAAGVETAAGREQTARSSRLTPWLAAAALLAILTTATFYLWPRTTVVVTAARQRLSLDLTASAGVDYPENQIAEGHLPAKILSRTGLATAQTAATGIRLVGEIPAGGRATLLNDGDERIAVPEGTIVATAAGVRYRTQAAVVVPAAKHGYLLRLKVSTTSGQAEVPILAEKPGSAGNVATGKIVVIVGPLGSRLRVVNAQPAAGGSDRRETIVAAEDIDRALAEAKRQIELEAADALRGLASTEQILLPESLSVKHAPAVVSPALGEPATAVSVSLPYTAGCLSLARTTLAKFLLERARRQIPEHFALSDQPVTYETLRAIPRTPQTADLAMTCSLVAVGRIQRRLVLAALAGRTLAEARSALLALPEIAEMRADIPPDKRFSRFAWLIKLVVPDQ